MVKDRRKASEPILEKEGPAEVSGRKWSEEPGKEGRRAQNSQHRARRLKKFRGGGGEPQCTGLGRYRGTGTGPLCAQKPETTKLPPPPRRSHSQHRKMAGWRPPRKAS